MGEQGPTAHLTLALARGEEKANGVSAPAALGPEHTASPCDSSGCMSSERHVWEDSGAAAPGETRVFPVGSARRSTEGRGGDRWRGHTVSPQTPGSQRPARSPQARAGLGRRSQAGEEAFVLTEGADSPTTGHCRCPVRTRPAGGSRWQRRRPPRGFRRQECGGCTCSPRWGVRRSPWPRLQPRRPGRAQDPAAGSARPLCLPGQKLQKDDSLVHELSDEKRVLSPQQQ